MQEALQLVLVAPVGRATRQTVQPRGDMSKITCAASVAVISLFAEGTLVQLWLK